MIRYLIIIGAIFIVYKLLTGDKFKKKEVTKKEQEKKFASGELVKDPICGAYVSKDSEIRVRDGEHIYRFCSYECRDRFLKEIGAEVPKKSIDE